MLHWYRLRNFNLWLTGLLAFLSLLSACSSSEKRKHTLHTDSASTLTKPVEDTFIQQKAPSFPHGISSKPSDEKHEADLSCQYTNQYSSQKRRSFYPFNKAKRIEVLSFEESVDTYPISKNEIRDSIILSYQQINKLTTIFYNYSYPREIVAMKCYMPRHKIIFYNSHNQPFAYIEFCLECKQVRHSEKIDLGAFCPEKWEMLRSFFQNIGVSYGLEEDNY